MASVSTDRRFGINSGIAIKVPCKAATTVNITLSGEQTIDGVSCVTGDRVLVKDQTTSSQNGIYRVDTGEWSRDADFDGSYDVTQGTTVRVNQGATNTGYWRITTSNPVVGSAIAFGRDLTNELSSISFIQSGTGAVTRTAQNKMRDVVCVFDFMTEAQIADVVAGTTLLDVTAAVLAASDAADEVLFPPGTYKANLEIGSRHCVLYGLYPHAAKIVAADNTKDVIKFNRPVGQNGFRSSVINIDTQGGLNGIHIYGGFCGANSVIDNVTCFTPSNAGLLIDTDPTDVLVGSTWIYGTVGTFRVEGAGANTAVGIKAVGYNMLNAAKFGHVSISGVVKGMVITETVSTGQAVHFDLLSIENTEDEAIELTGTVLNINTLYTEKIGNTTNTADINMTSQATGDWRAKVNILTPYWGSHIGASAANTDRIRFSTNYCTANIYDMPAVGTFSINGNSKTSGSFINLFGYACGMTVNSFNNQEVRSEPSWQSVAHSAGNFTANGSMTWTVASGDQVTYAYLLNGKTMTVAFALVSTTVGGVANYELRIAIPLGKTAAKTIANACFAYDNGTGVSAYCQAAASGTYLTVYRADGANWALSTNNTDIRGQITFEIQ